MAKGLRRSQHQSLTETAPPRLLPFVCNSGIISSREESLQKRHLISTEAPHNLTGISKEKKKGPPHGQSQGSSHSFSQYVSDNQGSVQFSRSVVSDSLRPHRLQYTRPPCPSPTPGVYSNPCPLSRWCHPTISSSVVPFSSHLQSLPASGSFQMSQFFA